MDEQTPQGPGVEQPAEHPPEIYCPRCAGGNPSKSILCMWCGLPLDQPPLPDRPPSGNLLSAYKRVIIDHSAESFASEVPGASWTRIWIGMLTVVISNLLVLVASLLVSQAMFRNVSTQATQVDKDTPESVTWVFASMSSVFDLLLAPAFIVGFGLVIVAGFFLNTLLVYWICRRLGGVGRTGQFGPDFTVHAYLLSLVTVPLTVATTLVSLVPLVGSFGGIALYLYNILLQYYAIRASMQMTRNNARIAIAILFAIGTVLGFLIVIIAFFFILSALFSGTFQDTFSKLRPTSP